MLSTDTSHSTGDRPYGGANRPGDPRPAPTPPLRAPGRHAGRVGFRHLLAPLVAALLVCLFGSTTALAKTPIRVFPPATSGSLPTCTPRSAIDQAAAYIRTQQQPDGSFPSIGQSSTADAVYSLVAAGVDPSSVTNNGNSPIDWIYSQTGTLAGNTGVTAKFLLALVVAGRSTVAPDGFDFVGAVAHAYNPSTGLYSTDVTADAYALIALRAAGYPVPSRAVHSFAALQQPDGGWSAYTPPTGSDTNTTAVAVIALVVNGKRGAPVKRALAYFHTQQSPDGGFTFSTEYGTDSDTNSTALVTLALVVAGEDLTDWTRYGNDPVGRLLDLQNSSGAFRYNDAFPQDSAFATFQAVPALAATACH